MILEYAMLTAKNTNHRSQALMLVIFFFRGKRGRDKKPFPPTIMAPLPPLVPSTSSSSSSSFAFRTFPEPLTQLKYHPAYHQYSPRGVPKGSYERIKRRERRLDNGRDDRWKGVGKEGGEGCRG